MAIAYGNSSSISFDSDPDASLTAPSISGSNTLLILSVSMNVSSSYGWATATYNSVDITGNLVASQFVNFIQTTVWYVINPASSAVFFVDHDDPSTNVDFVLTATYYTGVHQTTPFRTVTKGTGTTTPATLAVTNSQTNDVIFGVFGLNDTTSSEGMTSGSIGAGQSFRLQKEEAVNRATAASLCDEPGATGTVTHSWTFTENANNGWTAVAIPLVPVASSVTYTYSASGGVLVKGSSTQTIVYLYAPVTQDVKIASAGTYSFTSGVTMGGHGVGLVPNVGEKKMLEIVAGLSTPQNLVLHLFKNDITPASTMVLADYTEATFTGYAPVTLSSANWTIAEAYQATATYSSSGVTFACSGTTNEKVYGFYLSEANTSELMWSERFKGSDLSGPVHYWKLEETSSTRVNLAGTGNNLTDNNGVTFGTGISGNAAKFVAASSQSLSLSNFSLPSSFTVDLWYNGSTDVETFGTLFSLGATWPDDVQLTLYRSGINLFARVASGTSGVEASYAAGWGTGHYVNAQITYSSSDKIVRLYVNTLGVFDSTGAASTALSTARRVGPDTLYLGNAGGLFANDGYDGLLDEVTIWDYVRTTDQRSARYANGFGMFQSLAAPIMAYAGDSITVRPRLALTQLPGQDNFWRLNETSGTRLDSILDLDLTQNNGVSSFVDSEGTAALFVAASSQYLSRAANGTELYPQGSYTVSLWFYPTGTELAATYSIIAKNSSVSTDRPFLARWYYNNAGAFERVSVSITSSTGGAIGMSTAANSNPVNQWNHLAFGYSTGDKIGRVWTNGGAPVLSGALVSDPATSGACPFLIGASNGSAVPASFFEGRIKKVRLFRRLLTTEEVEVLSRQRLNP